VLGFRVDADGAALLFGLALGERDDLLQCRDLELAVELLRALGEVLNCTQPLDLGQREIGGEEALVRRAVAPARSSHRARVWPAPAPARPRMNSPKR